MTLLWLALLLLPQTRDATPTPTGTALLSGVVTSDDAGRRPIARATVLLLPAGGRTPFTTATDDNGRFTFINLPAGQFTLVAQKPAFVTTTYGAKRPGATVGVPLALADGDRLTNVVLRMLRGAAITGTVVDETGRPMPGVSVRVRQVIPSATGGHMPATTIATGPVPTTDDRGVYRMYGLAPGDYLVSIQPPRVPVASELRQITNAELQWAEQQLRVTTTGSPSATPTTAPSMGRTVTYSTVFYPGAGDESAATLVTVAAGQERTGIDIRSVLIPTARIDGVVTGPDGQPAAGVSVSLLPNDASRPGSALDLSRMLAMAEVGLAMSIGARTGPTGAFTLTGVPPGSYSVMASSRAAPGRGVVTSSPGLWAMTSVTVNGEDISNIGMTLAPGMSVSGRFAFDGTTRPPDQARVAISITSMQSVGASVVGAVNLNSAEPVFTVTGLAPGHYRISATIPAWTLASAMLGGRNVADVPFEIRPGESVSNIQVTFTDSPPELSGRIVDTTGRPARGFVMLLFTADRSLWYPGSRRLRAPVTPASDGSFKFTGLVPGEYFLAAATDVSPNEWSDPSFLEQVALTAIKLTLSDGEKKVQDVRVGGL